MNFCPASNVYLWFSTHNATMCYQNVIALRNMLRLHDSGSTGESSPGIADVFFLSMFFEIRATLTKDQTE